MHGAMSFWQWFDAEAAPRIAAGFSGGRDKTFRKMFEHLDKVDGPVRIIETGCVGEPDNWAGNGCSTILFDRYLQGRDGTLRSVDINKDRVAAARCLVSGKTKIHAGDSVKWLHKVAGAGGSKVDLLYLDSFDLEWSNPVPAALHHLNELMAAMPMLKPTTLVAVDDSPAITDDVRLEIGGKGSLVAKYAASIGADLEFLEYQAGWTNMTAVPDKDVGTIERMLLRARAHVEAERIVAAEPLYRLILNLTALTPQPWSSVVRVARGEACAFFARMMTARGRVGTAVDWYHIALHADPKATEYRMELAVRCYLSMHWHDMAVVEARVAASIEPDNPRVWRGLGNLEHEANHAKESIAAFDKALEVSGSDAESLLDRATIAMDVVDYDLVKEIAAKVMPTKFKPDASHLLAMVAYREGRYDESIELFDRAIEEGCRDPATVQWHKSHSLESIGRYREANAARAWRAQSITRPGLSMSLKRFSAPLWTGQPPPATVHVHAESGAGDNICLLRYLPILKDKGYAVHYEAQDGMEDLVRHSMPEIDVMPLALDYPGALGVKPFDYHLPIGEIMHAFDTTVDTIPWRGPYLRAPQDKVEEYGRRLPKARNVGLCWSSGIRTREMWLKEYGLRKSMHFRNLEGVVSSGLANFISLQVGPEREQHEGRINDLMPDKPTWIDSVALIANLDLVITVDTAVAHLAGAMGKPTWLMMHPGGSWHWMVERPGAPWNEASPWYPQNLRIFRQKKPGDWSGVISRVADAIKAFKRE